jgi:RNA polymerase sigma-70 factor (ECF subfamily)
MTQEALLRAWRKRFFLKNEAARRAWLFRIATNLYRDHCRRLHRVRHSGTEIPFNRSPSPEQSAVDRELQDHVFAAMNELPERQREVMHLRVVEQLSPREIAAILGIDASAVRASLAAARKRLRAQLKYLIAESSGAEDRCASRGTGEP